MPSYKPRAVPPGPQLVVVAQDERVVLPVGVQRPGGCAAAVGVRQQQPGGHDGDRIVVLELLAAGLIYSAFLSTAVVGVLHLYAVIKRIHTEEEVLFQIPAYGAAMTNKARLLEKISEIGSLSR